jgi:uncharacterized protein
MVFSKWGGGRHWEYDAWVLGDDEHGTWVGAPAGTRVARPGAAFESPSHFVSLVPRNLGFVATFYGEHPGPGVDPQVELYVDITTVPTWQTDAGGSIVRMVDLDLDVLRGRSGRVWVDDEDEFADHRVRYGYPADLVRLAASSCDQVRADVLAGRGPFGGDVGRRWLSRLGASSS